jgi:hypothetical protein
MHPEKKHDGKHQPECAEVKERIQLCLYFPSGSPWPVVGKTMPLRCRNQRCVFNTVTKNQILFHDQRKDNQHQYQDSLKF